jgi:hypothetical protein
VVRLEASREMPLERFMADRDAQGIACYRLLISIEAALAVERDVMFRSKRGRRSPNTLVLGVVPTAPPADRLTPSTTGTGPPVTATLAALE